MIYLSFDISGEITAIMESRARVVAPRAGVNGVPPPLDSRSFSSLPFRSRLVITPLTPPRLSISAVIYLELDLRNWINAIGADTAASRAEQREPTHPVSMPLSAVTHFR